MLNDPIVIVGAARTPMGGFQGDFAALSASELGAVAIKAAVERAGIAPDDVEEVIMGCVLPAGPGPGAGAPGVARRGLPLGAGCTTVNKMCGSGMKAVMLAHDLLAAGTNDVIVAGGMESMTNAPYLLPKARAGYRMGHAGRAGPHVPRRPRGRLRQGPADGHLRRGLRATSTSSRARSRTPSRSRSLERALRAERGRRVRLGDRAGHGGGPQGRGDRRSATSSRSRPIPTRSRR